MLFVDRFSYAPNLLPKLCIFIVLKTWPSVFKVVKRISVGEFLKEKKKKRPNFIKHHDVIPMDINIRNMPYVRTELLNHLRDSGPTGGSPANSVITPTGSLQLH